MSTPMTDAIIRPRVQPCLLYTSQAALGLDELKRMGVVLKRAQYFITCRGFAGAHPGRGSAGPVSYTHLDVYKRQGDGFNAGFLAGILQGRDVVTAGRMGAICGALATQTLGGVGVALHVARGLGGQGAADGTHAACADHIAALQDAGQEAGIEMCIRDRCFSCSSTA